MFDVHHVTLTLSENCTSVEGLSGAMFNLSGAEVCYCVRLKTRVHAGRCVVSPLTAFQVHLGIPAQLHKPSTRLNGAKNRRYCMFIHGTYCMSMFG